MDNSNSKKVSAAPVYEPELHLVVFKLGNEDYGVKIEQVKEVTLTPEIARMPKTPTFIKGVSNIRGDIIAIMDLEDRFNIKRTSSGSKNSYTLVIESPDYTIGIIVKEVPQSLTIPYSKIDKAPNIVREKNINENYIDGIGKADDGRLVIILDIYKILSTEEIEFLTSVEAGK
jgi:purine-binding chemotaxis protein CheW